MSPHIEPLPAPEEGEDDEESSLQQEIEPLFHCTECEYVAPNSEFIPVDYR